MERHPAMVCQNHTAGCLPCQNGTVKNPETGWRLKGPGIAPPTRCRQTPVPTPEITPPLPGTPPAATPNSSGAYCLENINLPAGYAYSHTSLPWAQSYILVASAQDSQEDIDIDPDMLTDKGTATG